jgi:protein-disulfide isomerase
MLADGAEDKVVLDSFKFKQGWVDIPELEGPLLEGKASAGGAVTLWVVMDYESPFAADSWQAALDIQTEYPSLSVRPLFWLPERHESAALAARAAFAANEQGKFVEMNALLLQPGASLDRMALVTMGESLGLDMSKFRAALVDAPLRQSVQSHVNAGQAVGVRGLPCYFVNGWRIRGVPLHEQVARLVALEKIP